MFKSMAMTFSCLLLAFATASGASAGGTIACEDLVDQFHENDTTVTSSTLVVTAGPTPAYCDVRGLIGNEPEPGKGIKFAVWLPISAAWNNRFYMAGGGGYAGSISEGGMSVGLNMGYATASTDTGHDSSVFPLATFALDDPQNERDYAYRAVHETVRTAKKLIMAHYGKGSDYNYWVGCSTGGRQGLMEAQRFPKDFDGLIIGAPVLDFTGTQIGGLWNAHAQLGSGQIFPGQLSELAAAEYGSCDGVDGVVDGVIRDPRDCSFDPLTDTNLTSFSDPQREALKHIYEGPKTSDGEPIFPGYLMGISAGGWIPWFIIPGSQSLLEIFGETFMQYMAFKHDPGAGYDWKTEFDFDSDPFEMEFMRKILDATNPDMEQLKMRGGKIIHYHGWADPALTAMMSVNYYESVRAKMGESETEEFYKMYMVPGMFHCGGGPGPNTFDVFTPLKNWVENGVAPEKIIATNPSTEMTRPLCPYPEVEVWDGVGDPYVAESFDCGIPEEEDDGDSD